MSVCDDMQLSEYLDRISSLGITKLKNGNASTIEEFYSNCVSLTLPSLETVAGWHKLLMQYVNDSQAIFFLRRYASASNNDWNQIRRGFLTKYNDGAGYTFCDNFFAHYFYAMAIDNYVPSYEDFKETVLSRKFPYGFRVTKEEVPLQAFSKGKDPGINTAGWKLAHIFSVNGNDYALDYQGIIKKAFPRGARDEWHIQEDSEYPYRCVNRAMTIGERDILAAHFLRLAHPMNYFLVPKQKNEIDLFRGNIGELKQLIEYMYLRNQLVYPGIFAEYQTAIKYRGHLEKSSYESLGKIIIDIKYGVGIANTNSIKQSPATTNRLAGANKTTKANKISTPAMGVTTNQLHEMAKLYLEQGLSFRNLERRVLGIDSQARGGGFKAKTALNAFGITAENKGALKFRTAEGELKRAAGPYRKALEELYQ